MQRALGSLGLAPEIKQRNHHHPDPGTAIYINEDQDLDRGERTQPPSLLQPPKPGSVRIWRAIAPLPLSPPRHPARLASCEISDSRLNHIICHRRHCYQLMTKLPANPAQISAAGGKRVHCTYSTQYTVHTFSWPLLSFVTEFSVNGPHSEKAPYNSLPFSSFPHLVVTYHLSGSKEAKLMWIHADQDPLHQTLSSNFSLQQNIHNLASVSRIRILIFTHSGSRISDPGSRIPDPKTAIKQRAEKKLVVKPFFVAKNFTKFKIILFFKCWRKKFGPVFYRTFYPKICH